jgi:Flp pilus assembly protein TadD
MLFSLRRSALLALLLPLALASAGCANNRPVLTTRGDVSVTGSVDRMTDSQIAAAASAWGQRYDADPKNRTNILNYAAALRLGGRTDQAVAVLEKGMVATQNDPEMSAAYGKALAANGNFDQALRVIRQTQQPDRPDWKLYSAEGAILDQQGNPAEARAAYQKALQIAPGEASIYNNLALSYLLAGDVANAETTLRKAAALPGATSRIRQNLALVLGLQGKFKEADAIARQELDPAQAETNVAYLKSMLSQTNTWKEARKQG